MTRGDKDLTPEQQRKAAKAKVDAKNEKMRHRDSAKRTANRNKGLNRAGLPLNEGRKNRA